MINKLPPASNWFQQALLAWFDTHGRKTLPWQQNKNPYRVWVSEIMLQQTQVSTVIAYFERFMQRFPDLDTLAAATEDEVMHYWTGLGYYSRARNLHRTAKIIQQNGHFPDDLIELEKLPGIGRSTAGAILAIAFQKKATILDGNVKRVLARFHAIQEWPGEKKVIDQLWNFAEDYTPTRRIADYTQAIMDLGATICIRGKPQCSVCPLQKKCLAHSLGIESTLPHPKPRKVLPIRETMLLILRKNEENVLLLKRPPIGVWAGLWSLPEISGTATEKEIKKFCAKNFNFDIKNMKFSERFRHTFSHFHLDILPVEIFVKPTEKYKVMTAEQQIWYNLREPATVGLPAPIKLLLSKLT